MNALRAVIDALVTVIDAETAAVFTPNDPPSTIADTELPYALIYPRTGSSRGYTHSSVIETATIRIDLAVKKANRELDDVIADAITLQEPLSLALWRAWFADQFGGTVLTIGAETGGDPIRWEMSNFEYGGQKTAGFRYELDVQVQEDI